MAELFILERILINMKDLLVIMGEFVWSPEEGIDVSSHGRHPYRLFSPFSYAKNYKIPVPGQEDIRADSVEGIWQGLKIINGQTDFSLLNGKPNKRKGQPEGHLLGKEITDYFGARKQIYVSAYVYHAVNNALPEAWSELEQRLQEGDVILHDVETNGRIEDLSSPFAHSALLVQLLNVLKDAPLPKTNPTHPNPHGSRFTCLHEQVNAFVAYRGTLSLEDQAMLDEVITFAYLFSPDDHKQTFALRTMHAAGIETDRIKRYTPTERTKQPYDCLRR